MVATGITLLSVVVVGAWATLLKARLSAVAGVLVAALGILGLAWLGVFQRFAPPPPLLFAVFLAGGFVVAIGLRADPRRLSLTGLIALQAFRLPLELVMHHAADTGLMPVQMSFSGWNFDILTGIGAVAVAALAWTDRAPKWLVMTWNVLGFFLLLTIVGIAIASTPTFAAFGTTPDRLNTWVADPPYVWLPTVLVPSALLGHLLVARRLSAR